MYRGTNNIINGAVINHIDINECRVNTDNCSHRCVNTDGSYYCNCNAGYQLQSDKHSCKGNN